MVKILGMEFAPLFVPMKRRLQTLAVAQWIFSFFFLGSVCLISTIALLFTRFWPVTLAYAVWFIYDRKTPYLGGRSSEFMRRLKVWIYFRDYLPLSLEKTSELFPDKNYIFACHPHGILCVSHFLNFATEGTRFSELFPQITPHLMVLDGGFKFPFFREYFLSSGACSCDKQSLEYVLTKNGTGQAACVVIGGALEALEAHPGSTTLSLANKKGFIKTALKTGASLVPVYSFGENDLFSQASNPQGSKLRNIQEFLTKHAGYSPPVFHGRGMLNYSFGLLPYRKPVTTIVGVPIHITQNLNPSQADIDDLHSRYMQELSVLFESRKRQHGVHDDKHLEFI